MSNLRLVLYLHLMLHHHPIDDKRCIGTIHCEIMDDLFDDFGQSKSFIACLLGGRMPLPHNRSCAGLEGCISGFLYADTARSETFRQASLWEYRDLGVINFDQMRLVAGYSGLVWNSISLVS